MAVNTRLFPSVQPCTSHFVPPYTRVTGPVAQWSCGWACAATAGIPDIASMNSARGIFMGDVVRFALPPPERGRSEREAFRVGVIVCAREVFTRVLSNRVTFPSLQKGGSNSVERSETEFGEGS